MNKFSNAAKSAVSTPNLIGVVPINLTGEESVWVIFFAVIFMVAANISITFLFRPWIASLVFNWLAPHFGILFQVTFLQMVFVKIVLAFSITYKPIFYFNKVN